MAAAAVSARTAAEILVRGYPAQLQRLINVLVDGGLNVLQFFLRIEKIASNRIVENSFALFFEIADLFPAQWHGRLLFFLQGLALGDEVLVLGLRLFVSHEGINPLSDGLHVGLVQDRLAQLFGLLQDRSFFSNCLHNV